MISCSADTVRPLGRFTLLLVAFVLAQVGYAQSATFPDAPPSEPPRQDYVHRGASHTVNIYHVPWDPVDAAENIQRVIRHAITPAKIVLDVRPTPWIVGATIELDRSDMEIWFAHGASVLAKEGAFKATNAPLFRISGDNVTMNGYWNGVDLARGRTTLEMRKADYQNKDLYTAGESRHCISVRGARNAVIQGFELVRSGGDGITLNNKTDNLTPPYNTVIKDVICDDNHRQGMSIISADTVTVTNCIFRRTNGTKPQAGVDIEPSRVTDTIRGIRFFGCEFSDNAGNNVEINLNRLNRANLPPVDVSFDSCLISGAWLSAQTNGMAFFSVAPPPNGPTGSIVVKNTVIRDTARAGVRFSAWAADRIPITMDNVTFSGCNPAANWPIVLFTTDSSTTIVHGDVDFVNGCHIDDPFPTRSAPTVYVGGNVRVPGVKDITGAITVTRPASSTGALIGLGPKTTNCTLTVTKVP